MNVREFRVPGRLCHFKKGYILLSLRKIEVRFIRSLISIPKSLSVVSFTIELYPFFVYTSSVYWVARVFEAEALVPDVSSSPPRI